MVKDNWSLIVVDDKGYIVDPPVAALLLSLSEERGKLKAALQWCSGCPSFAAGGDARKGWLKVCKPLLDKPDSFPKLKEKNHA